ncbi:MAG: DUF2156 domain-containing protein [Candidatus Omnitrophica bacterium]|nr:DUF2156 domain-containing protein [Candidatus Omnitrophota bacterium]
MRLNKLSLKDKRLFDRYLSLTPHELSVYSFVNIYIWKALFEIYWAVIEKNLCVFFKDRIGLFMYLEPLSKNPSPRALSQAFRIMDSFNKNKSICRIENIEEKNLDLYRKLGYGCVAKEGDYLCISRDLAELKGNRFKSKRSSVNYFLKNYNFNYAAYSQKDEPACLSLYSSWMSGRKCENRDKIYCGMLEDSFSCLKILLQDYSKLECIGRVVKVRGKAGAFTFGFPLNKDTFCILYEVTDLSIKGLAQFIFWKFSNELKGYRYINIMDDSGLENLKRVKLSFCPDRLVSAYIVLKKYPQDRVR